MRTKNRARPAKKSLLALLPIIVGANAALLSTSAIAGAVVSHSDSLVAHSGSDLVGDTSAGASSGVVIKEPQYGFSFTLPSNWQQLPLNGSDVTALLNAATHDDPTLANALDSEVISAASKGIKVLAIGPVVGSTVPNANVIVLSSAGAPTGSAFAQEAVAEAKIELAQVGASQIKTSIVKNRLGTSAQATYELNLKTTAPEFGEQFYVQHKSYVEIVTVSTSNLTSTQSNGQLIIDSWRW